MRIEAVIFDLDGTLADTLDGIVVSLNEVLQQFGFPIHDRQAYRRFIGDGVEKLVERALPTDRLDLRDEVLELYLPLLTRRGRELSQPYEGVDRVLDELTRRGLPFAVLSNKPHEQTVDVVAHLFSAWSFRVVRGWQANGPLKPDSRAASEIASVLDVPSRHCAFVGDSGVDMQTAINAKMIAVGAAYGLRGRDELIAAGADQIIDTPTELLDLIAMGD
jgi:phosphoglycolate phosphatase